jgi:DNA-directed RNA polymerase subunit N (RpoN/RPB10)
VPYPDADGFQRAELGKEKLVGTVGFRERQVFLCYKVPEEWPSYLEAAESERLLRLLAAVCFCCRRMLLVDFWMCP